MSKFEVSAVVTISISTTVEAANEAAAIEEAETRMMQGFCYGCCSQPSDEVWVISGELDGQAQDLKATKKED